MSHSVRYTPGLIADRFLRELITGGPADSTAELAERAGVNPRDTRLSRSLQSMTNNHRILNDHNGSGYKRSNLRANPLLGICTCCDQITGYDAVAEEANQ